MRTLIASVLCLLLGPVAAVATTMVLAKLTGRLDRGVDRQGRAGWLFAFTFGSHAWEFLVGFARGLVLLAVVRILVTVLNPHPIWPLIVSVALPLVGWEVWRLRFHRRLWPVAASAGVQSWDLNPAEKQQALANALEGGQNTAALMRAAFYGDLVSLALGTFLLFGTLT